MKTLDEVIKGFECCENTDCDNCPYKILFNDDSHVPCDQFSKDADALHYLKEYRKLDSLDAVTFPEDANDPLTFEEVRDQLGKPVWMEWGDVKGWRLVNWFDSTTSNEKSVALTDRYGVDFVFSPETFAKCEVMVYRKERS